MTNTGFELSASQADSFRRSANKGIRVNCVTVAIADPAQQERVAATLAELVASLEILRTTFQLSPGALQPLQVVAGDGAVDALMDADPASDVEVDRGPLLGWRVVEPDSSAGLSMVLWAPEVVADHRSLLMLGESLNGQRPIDPDPLQFPDFAGWEHEQATGDTPERRLAQAFWGTVTAPSTQRGPDGAITALPLRISQPAAPDTWLTAWLTVLRRNELLTEDRFSVRVLLTGRPGGDLESAIGPFARILAVPVTLDPAKDAATNQVQLRRTIDQAERFIVYADTGYAAIGFSHYPSGTVAPEPQRDLDAELIVVGDGPTAEAVVCVRETADTRETAHTTAQRLVGHLGELLVAALTDPGTPLGHLPMLTAAEARQLRELGAGPNLDETAETVLTGFARQVVQRRDVIAVDDGSTQLSFAELDERSSRVAAALLSSDPSGAPIGIAVDRSVNTVIAIIAAMKCGVPFQPVHPALPPQRIAEQLAQGGSRTLVLASRSDDVGIDALRCVALEDLAASSTPLPAESALDPDGAAYLMSTSGSTGVPKVVVVRHRNVIGYAAGVAQRLGLAPGMRLGVVTMLNTDLAYTMVMPGLVGGSTVRLLGENDIGDVEVLNALVVAEGIDALKMTPSHLRALLADPAAKLRIPLLVLGGEALTSDLAARAFAAGAERVVNHYGPTETTVGALTHEIDAGSIGDGPVPIGRALPGVRTYVLDEWQQPVPWGVVGQLAIAGVGVSAGYHGAAEATAERFISESGPAGGALMYLTGDLVRLDRAGDAVFLGRADGQVKVRGYRVELGDIEHRLRAQSGIVDAAVVVDPRDPDADRLLAYVAVGDPAPSAPDLRAVLAEQLPEYMIPAQFLFLAALPRTSNGKLDRAGLPDPEDLGAPQQEIVPPSTDVERELLAIWLDVLPTGELGVTDDFFQIGGHSLLATRIMARARSHFDVDLPLHLMFSHPSVRAMSAEIESRRSATSPPEEMSDLLAALESMSEEEAQALLAQELGRSHGNQ